MVERKRTKRQQRIALEAMCALLSPRLNLMQWFDGGDVFLGQYFEWDIWCDLAFLRVCPVPIKGAITGTVSSHEASAEARRRAKLLRPTPKPEHPGLRTTNHKPHRPPPNTGRR